jgi:hypothetical protein
VGPRADLDKEVRGLDKETRDLDKEARDLDKEARGLDKEASALFYIRRLMCGDTVYTQKCLNGIQAPYMRSNKDRNLIQIKEACITK